MKARSSQTRSKPAHERVHAVTKKEPKGYLSLVLHAHLPFVRHPEDANFLEENWLYEAITETYIPLIHIFDQLIHEGIDFRVTMSMTPPLVAMLQDELLQDRYVRHIEKLIELSEKEIERTRFMPHYHPLAQMYNAHFKKSRHTFVDTYRKDLVAAFRKFQDIGCVEIITCGATHGFLPILNVNPMVARAQVQIGVDAYTTAFGRPPKGIWLPECGYLPGIDEHLKAAGIKYFFVDSHGIIHADPIPRHGIYAPIYCPSGVAAFGRDTESSKQVWSAKEGYPGDSDYREYYRDIGHELELDYIGPYIHPSGLRINTGMKYWRITGQGNYKEAYNPHWAREKAAQHAGNFMFNREKQVQHFSAHMDRKPMIIAPYDAELFGHWWYEGPQWIDFLIRKIAFDQDTIALRTPSEYLQEYPVNQMAMPSGSSWGYKGYNEFWLNDGNDWVYPHIHMAGTRMCELGEKFSSLLDRPLTDCTRRAFNQAARELLLAEASDWPFIMKTGTMVAYAEKRVKTHIGRFTRLYTDLLANTIDPVWLAEVEHRDTIFSDMDCARYYCAQQERTVAQKRKVPVASTTARASRRKKRVCVGNK